MTTNVIRQDIIEVLFDTDLKELTNITKEINGIKKSLSGGLGDDAFEDLNDDVKDSADALDKANKEAKNFNQSLKDIGRKGATMAYNGLKKVASVSFKAMAVGIGAAATAVGVLVKNSVAAYADYEQLVGGVDTLFKDASSIVQKNANNAYKTAGLSANAYMETVTSFSASLISSLKGDTKEAAKLADMAIIDMSDNANKMGTDMGSLQYAYQGFAKQNYTMLDNLKLGYGGTKTEMERLIKDAAKMTDVQKKLGITVDAGSMSYSNIVKAIHVVQSNMDIMGTTQKEAEKTITGSLNSMKSAWGNLMPALIKGGDSFDQCVDNLVSSAKAFVGNIKPAITKALSGVGSLITELSPMIESEFPVLVDELLPPLLSAGTALLKGFIKALPNILKTIIKELPDIFKQLGQAFGEAFGDIPFLKSFGDIFAKNGDKIAKFTPILLGLVGAFMAFNKIKSIGSVMSGFFGKKEGGAAGGEKGGMFGGLTDLAKIKTTDVLKGMANLAIIIGGFTLITAAFMAVSPHLAKIGDTASIVKMIAIIGVLGIVGGVLTKFAGTAGNMPVTTVLKGIANIAITMSGLTALFMLIGAVSLINFDLGRIAAITLIIGLLGTIGAALTVFAGICGLIPIYVVALGLANMAIVIAGMTALLLLIGAASLINFNYGNIVKVIGLIGLLGTVGTVLTVFAGICGLIPIPVVLAGLTNMALVLGGITGLIIAFGKLSKVKGINEFLETGGALLAKLFNIIGEIGGSLIGGLGEGLSKSLPTIGENIADFAGSIKPLFSLFNGVDMSGVGAFFDAIGGFMLKMAGGKVLEFFGGKNDFSGVADGLNTLATSEGIKKFFNMVSTIEEGAFDKSKKFFEALDGIGSLPNVGGVAQWFSGKNDFSGVAKGLEDLSGNSVKNFFAMVSTIEEGAFDKSKLFFEALDGIGSLPNVGGFAQWFSGENDFTGVASGLEALSSEGVQRFFTMVNSINLKNLNGLWKSLGDAGKLTTENLGSVIDESISDMVDKISELPKKMGDALKNNSRNLSNGFVEMWKEAVKASIAPVNKLLDGANHILKEFGSKKKVIEWTPYARGTGGHRGGNALVNDGNGAELIQMPNGRMFILNGRNVFLPNAPKGMKVLPAEQTARLMGRKSPTFKYANGTGDLDVWSYYGNAEGLVNKITKSISYSGMSAFASNVGQSMVSTFSGEMPAWIDRLFEQGGQGLSSYVASKGAAQWLPTIIRALKMEGQYSTANVARTLFQMKTESGGNPRAINLWDSNAKKGIPSKGLMQVIDPTFNAYARAGFNKNIYDPLSNILASIRYAVSRYGSLSKAYRGVGYADGVGTITMPQASPLNLSYTPDSSYTGGRAQITEHNTYAPEMHFHIDNASGDDRALMRKIKRAVQEAIADVIDGAERSNPRLREV